MSAQPQCVNERELLCEKLRKSRDAYLSCVKEIPEAAANVRLSPDSWSILELAEHVAVAEHGMYRAIELSTEKTSPPNYAADLVIETRARNREMKLQAPERAVPKGRWKSLAEAVDAFEKSRARALETIENGAKDLRKIQSEHPLMGPLDGHQMALIMAAHPERHVKQIEEIKSTPAYIEVAGGKE
jgi:DinB superfamily